MTSGPVVAFELMNSDAIRLWRKILGPTDSDKARQTSPDSVRAKFGRGTTHNAAHGSDSKEAAKRVGLRSQNSDLIDARKN